MNRLYQAAHHSLRLYYSLTRPYMLGVRVLVLRDQQVLLVRHTYRRDLYLPGGGVDRGESLEEAARREVLEEAGVRLGALSLHGIFTGNQEGCTDHVVVFATQEVLSFDFRPNTEIESASFHPLADLPPDLSPASRRRILEYTQGGPPRVGAW